MGVTRYITFGLGTPLEQSCLLVEGDSEDEIREAMANSKLPWAGCYEELPPRLKDLVELPVACMVAGGELEPEE